MNVAIFGGGSIGRRHAANARALGHAVTVIETDPYARDRITATLPGVRAFGILGGFDEPPPEAAIIATPAHTHDTVAESLLLSGYRGPLFVEKPISVNSDAPIFRSWPHPVQMVGYNWRFHPDLQIVRDQLQRIFSAHLQCATDMRSWPGHHYAAPLFECSHEIDLALSWFGTPTLVRTNADPGGALLSLTHEHGDCTIDVRWFERQVGRTYRVRGTGPLLTVVPCLSDGLKDSYVAELQHFFTCIEHGRTPDCTFADGLAVVEVVNQALRMAA